MEGLGSRANLFDDCIVKLLAVNVLPATIKQYSHQTILPNPLGGKKTLLTIYKKVSNKT